ncbi:hypothetical protein QQ045_016879 [Rhodiola kirilowii]
MDVFGQYIDTSTSERLGPKRAPSGKKRPQKRRNDPLKIVYISSPMKVKTCESKFRSLVQELTGKDSQVAMLMEVSSSHEGNNVEMCQPFARDLRSSQVEKVVEKVELLEQWPVNSDQSLMTVEEGLGSYAIDERLAAGGGGDCGWDFEFPWHLFTD